jgi:hypothetical protein
VENRFWIRSRKIKKHLILPLMLLVSIVTSCGSTPVTNPVQNFVIIITSDNYPSTFIFLTPPGITMPFPTEIKISKPNCRLEAYLRVDPRWENGEVTFSKYTIYNEESTNEIEISTPNDLVPQKPGDKVYWVTHTPAEPGKYEIRVYFGGKVVASESFEVKQ